MKTLRTLLREGDPIDREPALPVEEVERMRRAVLAAQPSFRPWPWSRGVAFAAALSVIVGAGVWAQYGAARHPSLAPPGDAINGVRPASGSDERRQLQFVTPGGTRVIWVFDSSFKVR